MCMITENVSGWGWKAEWRQVKGGNNGPDLDLSCLWLNLYLYYLYK